MLWQRRSVMLLKAPKPQASKRYAAEPVSLA
nr:MAG TPA: hypothetical protein [Caudoviricetes sp.]